MIYAFLSGMYVFHWKGMCSSAVSNAPNGTTLYCSAGISAALHIHSLAVTETQDSADQTPSVRMAMLGTGGGDVGGLVRSRWPFPPVQQRGG